MCCIFKRCSNNRNCNSEFIMIISLQLVHVTTEQSIGIFYVSGTQEITTHLLQKKQPTVTTNNVRQRTPCSTVRQRVSRHNNVGSQATFQMASHRQAVSTFSANMNITLSHCCIRAGIAQLFLYS